MAISIIQQPPSPNAAYTRLPYVISGSTYTSQPQFEYVFDIYESGSNTLISRLAQPLNSSGVAVFEPSNVFQGSLDYESPFQGLVAPDTGSAKEFIVKVGEKYGTSISSSVTVYPNQTSSSIQVTSATVDSVSFNSFNLDTQYVIPVSGSTTWLFINADKILSNDPYSLNKPLTNKFLPGEAIISNKPIGIDDYATVSVFNNQPTVPILIVSASATLGEVGVSILNPNEQLLFSGRSYIKLTPSVPGQPVPITGSLDGFIATVGVGPKNLYDVPMQNAATASLGTGSFGQVLEENPGWSRIQVNVRFFPSGSTIPRGNDFVYFYNENLNVYDVFPGTTNSVILKGLSATNYPQKTCGDKTRFAFINEWGVYDYYSIYNQVKKVSEVQRENVTLSNVDYSSNPSTFDITRRGNKNYFTDYTDNYQIKTDYIDQVVATWLGEMLRSPSVFIQDGDDFIPIIITNSSFTANTNTGRQKLFQYTIQYKYANQRYAR